MKATAKQDCQVNIVHISEWPPRLLAVSEGDSLEGEVVEDYYKRGVRIVAIKMDKDRNYMTNSDTFTYTV